MDKAKLCLRCLRVSQKLKREQALAKPQTRRHASSFSQIRDDLTSRQLPLVYDTWNTLQSQLLKSALADFLPPERIIVKKKPMFPGKSKLQPGFHLIYFPPASKESELLSDGTDPLQSPGPPYVRRMWAGGNIQFRPNGILKLKAMPAVCQERITDVTSKGSPGEEKIFVSLERRMGSIAPGSMSLTSAFRFAIHRGEEEIRQDLDQDANCQVIENRTIVFMRERAAKSTKSPHAEVETAPAKILKPLLTPEFTHTLVPSPTLLYRFSGLTFNAHRIHLDKQYCQQIEGHRGLLVHGPLSLVIMMQIMKQHLGRIRYGKHNLMSYIDSIEYRNLAPLYAEEEMTVCVCKTGDAKFEVWIQGPDGGVAVRGIVRTILPKILEDSVNDSEDDES